MNRRSTVVDVIDLPTGRAGARRLRQRRERQRNEAAPQIAELQAKWMERWSDPVALMLRLQEVLDDCRASRGG